MKAAGRVWLNVAAFMMLVPVCACASEFGEQLQAADAVRSSDPAAFSARLAELEQRKDKATTAERQYLRLLQNYRSAIAGNYGNAVGDAVALYDQAANPMLKFRAALLVANVSAISRDFMLTLRYLEHALELQPEITDPVWRHGALTVASTVYNEYGQYELARGYSEQALADDPAPYVRCLARQNQFEALHHLGHSLDNNPELQKAISDCVAQGQMMPATYMRSVQAKQWAATGRVRQAVSLLEAVLPDAERTGYTRLLGEIHGLLAQYRMQLGESKAAEAHARHVLDIDEQESRWSPSVAAHQVLYKVALEKRDFPTALDAYRRYAEADKARLDDVKAREYAFQLSRYEIAQKTQSIELLKNQNQLLRLQQEVARKDKSNSQLLIALLVVLASSLGYWGWRGRRMHRTLRQLAQTDSLTGLANRRHFRQQSESLLAQARQRGRPMSLLLFDLDHFKQINDQCGHAAGDWVLREVARVGRIHCRPGDVFGRIGGEEFAVTLVDCDLGAAEVIAERMRDAIAAIDGQADGCPLPVSASVGCVATSVSGHDYETLVAHADAAMYRSKVGGRNRISRYQTASITPVPVRLESVPTASTEAVRAS